MRRERSHIDKIKKLCDKLTCEGRQEIQQYLRLVGLEAEIDAASQSSRELGAASSPPPTWWTLGEVDDFVEKHKSQISRAASRGKLLTNSCTGRELRIHYFSVVYEFLITTRRRCKKLRDLTHNSDIKNNLTEIAGLLDKSVSEWTAFIEWCKSKALGQNVVPDHMKKWQPFALIHQVCLLFGRLDFG